MKKIVLYTVLIAMTGLTAKAQTDISFEYFNVKESLIKNDNAAWLNYMMLPQEGVSELGAHVRSGNLRHPLDARRTRGADFKASRYQRVKDWTFFGQFNFETYTDKAVAMTAHTDPNRDNPYQIIDSLSGDWKKQEYGLRLKVASPKLAGEKLSAGLDINYQVKTGARQKDPRALDNSNWLDLTPGIVYELSSGHLLGLDAHYGMYKEDLDMETIGNYTQHYIYKRLGTGEYQMSTPHILISGLTRIYEGNTLGGDIHYTKIANDLKWTINAGYKKGREDATDGTLYPQKAGTHVFDLFQAAAYLDWNTAHLSHQIGIDWSLKDIDNKEYHQIQNPDTKQYETVYASIMNTNLKTRASLSYLISEQRVTNQPDWWLNTRVGYHSLDNRYPNPINKQIIDKMNVTINLNKSYTFTERNRVSFTLGSNYDFTIDEDFIYTDKTYSTNFVAEHVFKPMHAYRAANIWTNAVDVQYVFRPHGNKGNQVYIKASGVLRSAMNDRGAIQRGDHRYNTRIAIGLYAF